MSVSFSPKYFKVGSLYRAKRSFMSGPKSHFVAGEILKYEDDFFSRYDEAFVYQFHSQTNGEKKDWWVFDRAPPVDWREFFEPVDR